MINKLVSSKAVIAKIIADLDLNEKDIKISDIRQWIADAMEMIGAVQQYEKKIATVPVINYQVKLPCELRKIEQVAYSTSKCNGFVPMRRSTHSFGATRFKDVNECSNECCNKMLIQDEYLLPLVKNLFNLIDDKEALELLNSDINIKQTLTALINQNTYSSNNGAATWNDTLNSSLTLQYDVKPGWLICNVQKGYVKIAYTAIPVDEDSMPLIPDNMYYFEAIFWYVVMKLTYPKYLNGRISANVYYDMRQSWMYYKKMAYADVMMPSSRDEMETIQNIWNTLYPELDQHDTFFGETGDEQIIYNQNRQ